MRRNCFVDHVWSLVLGYVLYFVQNVINVYNCRGKGKESASERVDLFFQSIEFLRETGNSFIAKGIMQVKKQSGA